MYYSTDEQKENDLKEEEIFKDPFWRSRAKIKISNKYNSKLTIISAIIFSGNSNKALASGRI